MSKNVDPPLFRLLSLHTYIHSCAFTPPPRLTLALSIQAMPTLKMMIVVSYSFLMIGPEDSFRLLSVEKRKVQRGPCYISLPPSVSLPSLFLSCYSVHTGSSLTPLDPIVRTSRHLYWRVVILRDSVQMHFTLALDHEGYATRKYC
jgi:hypothetical protein